MTEERVRHTCVDCGARSPETDTNYTPIGIHGWRLARGRDASGQPTIEWRCPECWALRKKRQPPAP
jgi:hypothetical protein